MACQVCKEFDNQSRINGPVQGKATLRSAEPELLLSDSESIMYIHVLQWCHTMAKSQILFKDEDCATTSEWILVSPPEGYEQCQERKL